VPQLYDSIGKNYAAYRKPDPRIAAMIVNSLGDARRVVNIGPVLVRMSQTIAISWP
jgi:hypothetical protein